MRVSEVLDVTGEGRAAAIVRAVEAVRAGQLVVMPTDTVYGIGGDAFSADGSAQLFAATGRDRSVPLGVVVRSPKQLIGLTPTVPETADRLMAAYWPGPLTLVLPAAPGLVWDLGHADGVVAVRMPLDDVALEVIRSVGPMTMTGAGRTGHPAATTVAEAEAQFGDAVAYYLDDGARVGTTASTIVDLTRREPHVLRPGPLDPEQVLAVARGELDPLEAAAALPSDAGELAVEQQPAEGSPTGATSDAAAGVEPTHDDEVGEG
jgi:L-threonylcarbamoyladenylate synthase